VPPASAVQVTSDPAHRIAEPVDYSHYQRVSEGLADRSALPIAPHHHDLGGLALVWQAQIFSPTRGEARKEERERRPHERRDCKRHRVTSKGAPGIATGADGVRCQQEISRAAGCGVHKSASA
jgi:hypothetical protein